jgi:hypothetical protein
MKTVLFHIDDVHAAKTVLARVRSRLRPVALDRLYPDATAEHDCKEFFASFSDTVNVDLVASALSELPGVSKVEVPQKRRLLG